MKSSDFYTCRTFKPSSFGASAAARSPAAPSSWPICWTWATLTGPDAQDFLHRVTTVNTQGGLATGEGQPGCLLTAQGKLRAYFKLWRLKEDGYAFEFDAGVDQHWKDSLFQAIEQVTFAEKMILKGPTPELDCIWVFAEKFEPGKIFEPSPDIRVCHQGSRDFGRPWLTVWGPTPAIMNWVSQEFTLTSNTSVAPQELESWRIQALSPWLGHELKEEIIPLEAGVVDAISKNKGCYPGQEVIERILSLGAPPRRLVLLEGIAALSRGDRLFSHSEPKQEVGWISSASTLLVSTPSGPRYHALALVRKLHAQEGLTLQVNESPLTTTITRIAPYV